MGKKLIGIAVAAIMLFGVFGLAGCDNVSLGEYKTTAKATIQTYALEKGLNNEYAEENWATIESLVAQGEAAVDVANNKAAVDTAVTAAKLAMDDVPTEVEMLNQAIANQVKQSYVNAFIKDNRPEATIDDVVVTEFLGIYNGSFVAVLNDRQNMLFTEFVFPYTVDELDFSYSNGYSIVVWSDGNFSSLHEALEQDLITKENLRTIHHLYNNKIEQQPL